MLAKCITPTSNYGHEVRYLALCPRYEADSLSSIRSTGGVVAVGRILSSFVAEKPEPFDAIEVEYWAVGFFRRLKNDEAPMMSRLV